MMQFEALTSTEDEILPYLENNRNPMNRLGVARRLGALAFASDTIAEADQYYYRSLVAIDWLLAKTKQPPKKPPTQQRIITKNMHALDSLAYGVYVHKEVPIEHIREESYNDFLQSVSQAAVQARPFFETVNHSNPSQQKLYGELVAIFNASVVHGLLLRDQMKGTRAGTQIALPAAIHDPFVIGADGAIELRQWNIDLFSLREDGSGMDHQKIYTRYHEHVPHNMNLDDDTAVVWTAKDLYTAVGQAEPVSPIFPLDILYELNHDTGANAALLDLRIEGLYRALATRTMGSIRGILPKTIQ